MKILKRNISDNLFKALKDRPCILINGPRQCGKSTLTGVIAEVYKKTSYITLDDEGILLTAKKDPKGFIDSIGDRVVIDEIQRAPELLLPIKISIDKNRKPGRFILTGSANVYLLPSVSESLAGRIEILSLYPFSQGELIQRKEVFIDRLFSNKKFSINSYNQTKKEIYKRVLNGGYPELVLKIKNDRKEAWFSSYINSLVQRDIKDISNIEAITQLPNILEMLASRVANTVNLSEISRVLGIPHTSLTRYINLLKAGFLIDFIRPFFKNKKMRIVKSPKLVFLDTGIAGYLNGYSLQHFDTNDIFSGFLFENFVITELMKQITWSLVKPDMYYYRDDAGREVDILLQSKDKKIAGIEVKLSDTIRQEHFTTLEFLRDTYRENFKIGIVIYTGKEVIPFGKNLYAIPVSALWE